MTPCSPCVRSKRPRVYRHHAHMLKHMCAWRRYTRGRFEPTHEDVLNVHTEPFLNPDTGFFHVFQRAATHKHTQTHTNTHKHTHENTHTHTHTPNTNHDHNDTPHNTTHNITRRQRQRETERDRERQRETERDRGRRQRETRQEDREREKRRRQKTRQERREDERGEKLHGKKQNINQMWKVLDKEIDLGEPTSFLDHPRRTCTCTTTVIMVRAHASWESLLQMMKWAGHFGSRKDCLPDQQTSAPCADMSRCTRDYGRASSWYNRD